MFDYDDDEILSSDDSDILGQKAKTSKYSVQSNGPFREILQEFINHNPNLLESMYTTHGIGLLVPLSIRFFKEVTGIFANVFSDIGTGSYERALIEVLDGMTNGQVTKQAHAFKFEKLLINIHHVINISNQIHLNISQSDRSPTKDSVALLNYLTSYLKITIYIRSKIIEQYYIACSEANVIPDQLVIDYGIKDSVNEAYATTDYTYAYRNHYSLGNVEDLRVLSNKRYDYLSDLIMHVVFLGDPIEVGTAN